MSLGPANKGDGERMEMGAAGHRELALAASGRANRRRWRAVPGVPAGQHLPRISSTFRGRARCTQQRPTEINSTQQPCPELRMVAAPARAPPRLPAPRSCEHQSRPAPPSVTCTPGPPRTRPRSRSPSLSGFCRPAAETTGNPELRRQPETTGDPELWRPVSERRTAAGPGTGTGLSEPPGYRSGSVVGGRIGGQRGVREWGRLPRGPLSHPLHPHPLHPHQVPYTLRLAGASRPQTVSRRGIPTP